MIQNIILIKYNVSNYFQTIVVFGSFQFLQQVMLTTKLLFKLWIFEYFDCVKNIRLYIDNEYSLAKITNNWKLNTDTNTFIQKLLKILFNYFYEKIFLEQIKILGMYLNTFTNNWHTANKINCHLLKVMRTHHKF